MHEVMPPEDVGHPDNPKVYVEIQFESQDAANTAVEQLNGIEVGDRGGVRRRRSVLTQANSLTICRTIRSRPCGVRRAFLCTFIRFSLGILKYQQPQLPRSEPDGQPTESSHLAHERTTG